MRVKRRVTITAGGALALAALFGAARRRDGTALAGGLALLGAGAALGWSAARCRRAGSVPAERRPGPGPSLLLPKVDLETGVRLTGGDRRLYRELLGQFEAEYRDRGGEIERQALAGNLEEAARLAHAVKGIAGVLAAKPLQEAAQRLETVFRRRGDFSGALGAFREELRLTLAFIAAGEGRNLTGSARRTDGDGARETGSSRGGAEEA